jgi:hypothetical protein
LIKFTFSGIILIVDQAKVAHNDVSALPQTRVPTRRAFFCLYAAPTGTHINPIG